MLDDAISNLNILRKLAVFEYHLLLISSFMILAEKNLINQNDSDKVYG